MISGFLYGFGLAFGFLFGLVSVAAFLFVATFLFVVYGEPLWLWLTRILRRSTP